MSADETSISVEVIRRITLISILNGARFGNKVLIQKRR
jgi:hypothetical protein